MTVLIPTQGCVEEWLVSLPVVFPCGSHNLRGPPPSCASSQDVAVSAGVGAQCSRVTVPPGCPAGVARGLVWAHALRTVAGAGPSPPRGTVDG